MHYRATHDCHSNEGLSLINRLAIVMMTASEIRTLGVRVQWKALFAPWLSIMRGLRGERNDTNASFLFYMLCYLCNIDSSLLAPGQEFPSSSIAVADNMVVLFSSYVWIR